MAYSVTLNFTSEHGYKCSNSFYDVDSAELLREYVASDKGTAAIIDRYYEVNNLTGKIWKLSFLLIKKDDPSQTISFDANVYEITRIRF